MFDARRLLDQVIGALPAEVKNGGIADMARRGADALPGGGKGSGLATGALAGGVLGLIAGNKKARKFATKSAGTALKLGGLAAVAAVGYTAWQRHRGGDQQGLMLPPPDSGFAPEQAPRGPEDLARGVLVAMIQGAKADGHIDAEEQSRIFGHIEALALDAEAKAFVMDELAAPADIARVTAYAGSPETATELYAAAFMAMDPDTPAERAFLTRLQTGLSLDPDLAAHVEAAVQAELRD